jgi:hypothetical protein
MRRNRVMGRDGPMEDKGGWGKEGSVLNNGVAVVLKARRPFGAR